MEPAERNTSDPGVDDDVEGLDDPSLEDALMDGLADDARLSSGVPDRADASDLDFIQMTGLTKPELARESDESGLPDDMDPNIPVSFYEEGVDDVDGSMTPRTLEDAPLDNYDEIVRPGKPAAPKASGSFNSVSNLKDIIAELADGLDLPGDASPEAEPAPEEASNRAGESVMADLDFGANDAVGQDLPDVTPVNDPRDDGDPDLESDAQDRAAAHNALLASLEALADTANELEQEAPAGDEPAEAEPTIPVEDDEAPIELEAYTDAPGKNEAHELPLPKGHGKNAGEESNATAAIPFDVVESLSRAPVETTVEDLETLSEDEIERKAVERLSTPAIRAVEVPDEEHLANAIEAEELAQRAAAAVALGDGEEVEEVDASVYAKPQSTKPRRQKRRHPKWRRRVAKWVFRLAALTLLAVGGYYAYDFYRTETASPQENFNRGATALADGRYEEAAAAYAAFADRHPLDALSSEARFMAAYALQLVEPTPRDRAMAAYERSIELFHEFISEYPTNPKRARAEGLIGVLHHRLGNHEEAISLLDDPERRVTDPESYLPSLRVLARSYAALGEIESAKSAFLRAASLEGNYTPFEDYIELGTMYVRLADQAESPDERRMYKSQAIEQLSYALRVPGLVRARRSKIETLRATLMDSASATGALAPIGQPAPTPEEPGAIDTSSETLPDAMTPPPFEPSAQEEAELLSNTAGATNPTWIPGAEPEDTPAETEAMPDAPPAPGEGNSDE